MKPSDQILRELQERDDFKVADRGFDGGGGIFTRGPMKNSTVIWSYAGGWEHVSINMPKRTPTWEEMCEIKDMFWKEDETCVEYHPAKKDYVNNLEHCLHIWKPIEKYAGQLPIPPSGYVGMKGVKLKGDYKKC